LSELATATNDCKAIDSTIKKPSQMFFIFTAFFNLQTEIGGC
jgi:hypothetical protein